MTPSAHACCLDLQHTERGIWASVHCDRFSGRTARAVGDQLSGLVRRLARRTLFVSLLDAEWVSSEWLGMLVGLHKRLKDVSGHLVVCDLRPSLLEIFRVTRLDTVLDLRPVA